MYLAGKPPGSRPDFTAPILEICRGFEDLLNDKLSSYLSTIQDTVNADADCTDATLNEFSEDILKKILKPERSMSLWKIAAILRLGRLIQAVRPDLLDPPLAALLAFSPGPADKEQSVFFSYIASQLRNGKVHSSDYTSAHGIWLLRKLVFGLDESRVGCSRIRAWMEKSPFKENAKEIGKKISETWAAFPGIVPVLWQALADSSAHTTAA